MRLKAKMYEIELTEDEVRLITDALEEMRIAHKDAKLTIETKIRDESKRLRNELGNLIGVSYYGN